MQLGLSWKLVAQNSNIVFKRSTPHGPMEEKGGVEWLKQAYMCWSCKDMLEKGVFVCFVSTAAFLTTECGRHSIKTLGYCAKDLINSVIC